MSTVTTNGADEAAKLYLEIIEQLGSYIAGIPYTIIDPNDLAVLELSELVRARWSAGPNEVLIYQLTDRGRFWLKGYRRTRLGFNDPRVKRRGESRG